jgi:hypothetical protein
MLSSVMVCVASCTLDASPVLKSAQIALQNPNRFISLQAPHYASRPESYTCKLPGGMGPIPQLKVRVPMEWIRQPSAAGKVARKSKRKIMEPKQTRSQREPRVRAVLAARAMIDRDVKIEHARIAHSERLSGAGSTWSPCNTAAGSTWSLCNTGAGSTWSPCNNCRRRPRTHNHPGHQCRSAKGRRIISL